MATPPIKGWIELPNGSFVPPIKCEAPGCDEWMCWSVAIENRGVIVVCNDHRDATSALLQRGGVDSNGGGEETTIKQP